MFDFTINCDVQCQACNAMDLLNQAGQIISNNLILTSTINVQVFVEGDTLDINELGETEIQTVKTVDPEDKVTRMYPTALLRQLDPNFKSDDQDISMTINANRDGSFWYKGISSRSIEPNQYDFLEFVLHELHHGLGIQSYWRPHQNDDIGIGLLPYFNYHNDGGKLIFDSFYETLFDKFLVSMRGGELVKTYTKALNDIAGPQGRQYNDFNDFFTQLRDKQQQNGRSYSMDMSVIATNQFRLGFVIDDDSVDSGEVASEAISLESNYNPFEFGKSIQHLNYDYLTSDDFLFVSVQTRGLTLDDNNANYENYGGGVGPSLFTMLESLGYKQRLPPRRRKPPFTYKIEYNITAS